MAALYRTFVPNVYPRDLLPKCQALSQNYLCRLKGAKSMSQIFEALRKAEAFDGIRGSKRDATESAAERRACDRHSLAANIRVYGHGQGLTPFFEENSVLNTSETGALLIMKTPVVAGEKLLLIHEA